MTKCRKSIATLITSAGLFLALLFGLGGHSSADTGDVVYQSCSTEYEFTVDDNDVNVVCDESSVGSSLKWMPILTPNTIPTVTSGAVCYIPGLQAKKSTNTSVLLTCTRHFDGYRYWEY